MPLQIWLSVYIYMTKEIKSIKIWTQRRCRCLFNVKIGDIFHLFGLYYLPKGCEFFKFCNFNFIA